MLRKHYVCGEMKWFQVNKWGGGSNTELLKIAARLLGLDYSSLCGDPAVGVIFRPSSTKAR